MAMIPSALGCCVPGVVALLLFSAATGRASDGVIEINAAKAAAGGINGDLALDPPGYPVRITQSGSYRLTSNLRNIFFTPDVIQIDAEHVELDLGGFSINGLNGCAGGFGTPVTCTSTGQGRGIVSSSDGVVVQNGSVVHMAGTGIALTGTNARVENIHVEQNGGNGIEVGFTARVSGSRAFLNFESGILATDSAQIRGCSAERNGAAGLSAGSNSMLIGNLANGNLDSGILCAPQNCLVAENSSNSNLGAGIAAEGTISQNQASENETYGIFSFSALIRGNRVRLNGCGIRGGNGALAENLAEANGLSIFCDRAQLQGNPIACNLVNCIPPTSPALFCPGDAPPTCL